jgi:trimeric autotransporter adhesin
VFGTAISTTVNSGAIDDNRAVESGTHVNSGGLDAVASGALAIGTVVSGAAAELLVKSGSTASGAILSGGGFDVVSAGGITVSTTISNGGIEDDFGLTSATRISSGGMQIVDVGGTASGSIVMSGGVEVVISGGTVGATTISGGFMEVRSGGTVGASTITFSGGGILQLDDCRHFGGLVAGFALPDLLDLRDIPFTSGVTSFSYASGNVGNTSGTLTVTSGGLSANITLIGQYMASQFHVQNDGAGGTTVTDPPVATATDSNPIAPVNTHH